ncbi:uncharacterized protein DS421_18g610720 [Arachis hypogaea]|nr:uncharacterized protein DS421_18g610720 [Arachis hypogaea]
MADDQNEDEHTASESEQEHQDVVTNDKAIISLQGADRQYREGPSGIQDSRRISSEVHEPEKEGQPHAADLMGLLHGHQGRLEQLKQELERQREAEINLRREVERRKELE